jgi:hypothetical protein
MNNLERFKNEWSCDEWKELMVNSEFVGESSSQLATAPHTQDLTRCGELAPTVFYGDAETRGEFQLLSSLRTYR